jgi:tetratricopeptide (TPR) repeat protein
MNFKIFPGLFICLTVIFSCKETNKNLLDKAYKLSQNKKAKEAIDVYSKIIQRDSTIQVAYYNRGLCYFEVDAFDKAINDFNKVISLQPKESIVFIPNRNSQFISDADRLKVSYLEALFQRAQVEYFMDSLKSSFIDFKACIDNGFELTNECYRWLGIIYIDSGLKEKGCESFNKALILGDTTANGFIKRNCD